MTDPDEPGPEQLVSTAQAAAMLGRSKATIRKWKRRGQLKAWRDGAAGQEPTLYLAEDVYRCATERVQGKTYCYPTAA